MFDINPQKLHDIKDALLKELTEIHIGALIEALNKNTEAILEQSKEAPVINELKKEEKPKEKVDLISEITNRTQEEVKTFAKEKIEEGVKRSDIKKIITKLGFESIIDMDQEGLNKLYKQLKGM